MSNIFTKSENFKSEYSCAVVRIGKLTPIELPDFTPEKWKGYEKGVIN